MFVKELHQLITPGFDACGKWSGEGLRAPDSQLAFDHAGGVST
jgi:hypothetical protein